LASPKGREVNEQGQLIRQKVCDTAEPWEICQKLLETGWERKKLWSGDYWFFAHDYKKVGITRKEVSDLMNSIGQVFSKQLEEMIDFYDIKVILLEGSWARVTTGQMLVKGIRYQTWDMVWNYLRRWQDKGFTLELTMSMGHTIDRLNKLYALYQKPYSLSANTRQFTDDRILAFPSGCRGKTAQQILDKGKSLVDIGQMGIEELKQYDKIGDKKASLIVEHFSRRTNNG
jgi:ERCC4-type nuclease